MGTAETGASGTTTTAATSITIPSMVSNMSTAAYLSNGIGINYYAMNSGMGAAGIKLANTTNVQQQHIYMKQQQTQLTSALQQQQQREREREFAVDSGLRRRLFAGFRPLSGFGRSRYRSSQHRSISLPESN